MSAEIALELTGRPRAYLPHAPSPGIRKAFQLARQHLSHALSQLKLASLKPQVPGLRLHAMEHVVRSCTHEANRAASVLAVEESQDGNDPVLAGGWCCHSAAGRARHCSATSALTWLNAPGMLHVLCLRDGFPWGHTN